MSDFRRPLARSAEVTWAPGSSRTSPPCGKAVSGCIVWVRGLASSRKRSPIKTPQCTSSVRHAVEGSASFGILRPAGLPTLFAETETSIQWCGPLICFGVGPDQLFCGLFGSSGFSMLPCSHHNEPFCAFCMCAWG